MNTMLTRWWTSLFSHSIKAHGRATGVARWVMWTTLGIYLVLQSMPPVLACSLMLGAAKVSTGQGGDLVYTRLIAADALDPTPNPCHHHASSCTIRVWAMNGDRLGYSSATPAEGDSPPPAWDECVSRPANQTLGQVISCWRTKQVLLRDIILPLPDTPHAAICLFAGAGGNHLLTPLSNCVRPMPKATRCEYGQDMRLQVTGSAAEIAASRFTANSTITCDSTVTGTMRLAGGGHEVPLTGGGRCELNLGSGFGVDHRMTVHGGEPTALIAQCRFKGVDTPGLHKGAGVLVFALE
ncbi:TPA: hypothetical protein RQN15_001963 [Aeromonas hydrophila]|nr:hypothetical protein [Aeromonas hydrophila]